jgi:hypothetical protein
MVVITQTVLNMVRQCMNRTFRIYADAISRSVRSTVIAFRNSTPLKRVSRTRRVAFLPVHLIP